VGRCVPLVGVCGKAPAVNAAETQDFLSYFDIYLPLNVRPICLENDFRWKGKNFYAADKILKASGWAPVQYMYSNHYTGRLFGGGVLAAYRSGSGTCPGEHLSGQMSGPHERYSSYNRHSFAQYLSRHDMSIVSVSSTKIRRHINGI